MSRGIRSSPFTKSFRTKRSLVDRIKDMTPLEVKNLVQQEWGFDFTAEEMQQVIFDRHPELTDEELGSGNRRGSLQNQPPSQ